QGTGNHAGFVAQNVAEHVLAEQDIELPWIPDQLHGGIVHIHMRELYVGILGRDFFNDLPPENARGKDVCLVDTANPLVPQSGGGKRNVSNPLNFRLRVDKCVECFVAFSALRRSKVDATGKLSNDKHVELVADNLGAKRTGVSEL